tara:strand:+ start:33029 stop:33682 length:654 start_codon:yes stop_codon:yes gene_type:complete
VANREQTVFVVDDDADVLDAMSLLLQSAGLTIQTFSSPKNFLAACSPDMRGCLILDIRMPDIDGLELQQHINDKNITLPLIFITGHGDVPSAVQAMKSGALEFLQKPFGGQTLLDAVYRAMELNEQRYQADVHNQIIRDRIASLTKRELEIMRRMVTGDMSKTIASDLHISPRTVEIHRSKVMGKMQAQTLAQLVQMVLQVDPEQPLSTSVRPAESP